MRRYAANPVLAAMAARRAVDLRVRCSLSRPRRWFVLTHVPAKVDEARTTLMSEHSGGRIEPV